MANRMQAFVVLHFAIYAFCSIIIVYVPCLTNGLWQMNQKIDLDRTDFTILRLLQNDARLSMKQIADAVALAPSSVHGRVQQLRESGVLLGMHAEVEPRALGIGLEALFMIELSKHERSSVDRFLDEAVLVPEVRFAFLVTGRYDLVVHVVARDMRHLKDLALDQFTNRAGVTRI